MTSTCAQMYAGLAACSEQKRQKIPLDFTAFIYLFIILLAFI